MLRTGLKNRGAELPRRLRWAKARIRIRHCSVEEASASGLLKAASLNPLVRTIPARYAVMKIICSIYKLKYRISKYSARAISSVLARRFSFVSGKSLSLTLRAHTQRAHIHFNFVLHVKRIYSKIYLGEYGKCFYLRDEQTAFFTNSSKLKQNVFF